jgi:hypothetical protein
MTNRVRKGFLRPLSLPDVVRHLESDGVTGALVLTRGNEQTLLYLEAGRLVAVVSSRPELRLSHRLMAEGVLSPSGYDALRERLEAGQREAPALVELGALTPASLWRHQEALLLEAATAPFTWDRGEYLFLDAELPEAGRYRANLLLADLVAEGVRRVEERELFRECIPSGELVVEGSDDAGVAAGRARLLPHEAYVRALLDGKRTAAEVAAVSDLGEFETYRTIYLLLATGHARLRVAEPALGPPGNERDLRPVLRAYNDLFACLQQYLLTEVGPIAVQLLEKSLREARSLNGDLFENVTLAPEGTLDELALERNLRALGPEVRRQAAITGLNEFVYATLLAVKRTLGPAHEAEAVRRLRARRPEARQALGS